MEHLLTVLAVLALAGGAVAASLPLSDTAARRARRDQLLAEELDAAR